MAEIGKWYRFKEGVTEIDGVAPTRIDGKFKVLERDDGGYYLCSPTMFKSWGEGWTTMDGEWWINSIHFVREDIIECEAPEDES